MTFIKTVIGDVVAHLKPQKNHFFVRFVMYCIITTCSVECYWHCSDGTVHYKSDKTVNFCGLRCATTLPITVFITALHVMQTRYCDEISVRPSFCPSVCLSVTRVNCDKTVERSVQIYIPYERTFILVF